MKEDIKILEEFIEDYNACYPEEKEWVVIYPNQVQAIENLINRNKELEEDYTSVYLSGFYDGENKWKSKIKEKIEELKETADEDNMEDFIRISALKKLLEVKISASANNRIMELEKENKTLKNVVSEIFNSEDVTDKYIPVSLVEEKILNPMKEEHDKAIKGFIKKDIPQYIEDGGIAQELGYFIGKIEELLEKRK